MAVLTQTEILKRIKAGTIKIEPLNKSAIGPASIDLHLDNQFRVFKTTHQPYKVKGPVDYQDITQLIIADKYFLLNPGQTAHGITIEKITLPDNICGWIEGRSSLGRLGLSVHITASFIQPGISNKQVLEMNNVGPIPLAIYPGIAVCQIILEETLGAAKYQGRFRHQHQP